MVLQIVGNDLLMSNAKRIEKAIAESACDLLLKVTFVTSITLKYFVLPNEKINLIYIYVVYGMESCFRIKLRC